ncbi:glycosyltransferase [Candidatus Nitrospira bockiana]
MKLLFLTGTLPYPPTDGWKIRVFAFLRALAERHDVSVVSFYRPIDEALAADRLREHGVDLHVIPRSPRYSPVKLAQGLFAKTAFPILNYHHPQMAEAVKAVLRRHEIDLIQAESLHTAQYALGHGVPAVLDLHNIESLLMKRFARQIPNPFKRLYAEVTWRKLATYERQVCPAFTHCLTCSDEERVLLQTCANVERVSVVPNGVHAASVAEAQPDGATEDRERVVFVGRMDYHANVEGVRWFCHRILPRIRARRPNVLFQIVGGHPVPAISRLAYPGMIEVTGFVTDVRPYLAKARAVVVPLRIGGGTRLKILEALAMGKAVVSTTLGAEGIEAVPGRDLMIADRPDDFAARVITVLEDGDVRRRLGAAGRRLAATKYDWGHIVKTLEGVYERCLDAGPRYRHAQPVA